MLLLSEVRFSRMAEMLALVLSERFPSLRAFSAASVKLSESMIPYQ